MLKVILFVGMIENVPNIYNGIKRKNFREKLKKDEKTCNSLIMSKEGCKEGNKTTKKE